MTAPGGQKTPLQIASELSNKLSNEKPTLDQNMAYYDATARPQAIGIGVPPEMRKLLAQIGWSRMYVNSIVDRLELEGFRMAGSPDADETLWEWWQANNLDEQAPLGYTESLLHGRAYITVSAPNIRMNPTLDPTVPVFRVESPQSFYAEYDPVTLLVRRAIRVYQDENQREVGASLFLENETLSLTKDKGGWVVTGSAYHGLGRPPVVPLPNRELLSKPFGASEITPEIRSATDAACRIMMDMQGAAELMAVPQRVLFGVNRSELADDPDDPARAAMEAYYSRILAFESETGSATQFTAADLQNFATAMDQLAKQVASYTGLPPQYLSFASDNPASAEAIKSSESRLVKKCERKARMFGAAWEEAMRIGMLVMKQKLGPEHLRMESIWRDPSTPTFAAKADAVMKLYANGMGLIPRQQGWIDMGYSPESRAQMERWDKENPVGQLNAMLADPSMINRGSETPEDE